MNSRETFDTFDFSTYVEHHHQTDLINPFKNLTASLKTLGASWKLALTGAMFGTAVGPVGAAGKAGVLGKITNAIARIAVIIKGIFSPASILGRFTSKIKGIFPNNHYMPIAK